MELPLADVPYGEETLMLPVETLYVAAGGALGALCRHGVSLWCADRFGKKFPYGTLLVNVAGSLLMGLLAGGAQRWGMFPAFTLFAGAGFLGALTTFSTFSMDTFAAFRDGHPVKAVLNIALNTILCLTATAAAFFLIVA